MAMFFRVVLASLMFAATAFGADPLSADFAAALKSFRAEGAKGWSFVQSTATRSQTIVERYDPSKPEFTRWTLLQMNGKSPTEKETRDYAEKQSRRSNNDTAPDVTKQLDLGSASRLRDDAERAVYRFHLTAGGNDDTSAKYMVATFTFHKPSATITQVELANTEPFSPMLTVKIEEARTVISYSSSSADRPSLLERITVHVRGRAMWFKSLDEDMTVTYSDYKYVEKKRPIEKSSPSNKAE